MGTNQDYSKTGFAENTNTLGLSICTQNMRITYENDFPWGQIKITQILDSQKITLRWASIYAPRSKGYVLNLFAPWEQSRLHKISIPKIKLHRASIFALRAWRLHMKMIFHGDRSRLIKFWTRRKYDYIIHQYFYPEHECYTWK